MNQALITTATGEVPKMFETGWDWWAWPIAWAVLALAALIMAAAVPMLVDAGNLGSPGLGIPAVILASVLILAAVVVGYAAPGVMMRHMDNGGGAFAVFAGSILVGLTGWGVSTALHGGRVYTYEARQWVTWIAAAPAVVIGLGAVFNGIGEIITRLAASIPMPVAQFGAILVLGALLFGLHTFSSSRR